LDINQPIGDKCKIFSEEFNIVSAFFFTNSPFVLKYSILARVWRTQNVLFDCFLNNRIFVYKNSILHQFLGYLLQNAVLTHAKRSANSCKTQG
jgi:hypothetical protein